MIGLLWPDGPAVQCTEPLPHCAPAGAPLCGCGGKLPMMADAPEAAARAVIPVAVRIARRFFMMTSDFSLFEGLSSCRYSVPAWTDLMPILCKDCVNSLFVQRCL